MCSSDLMVPPLHSDLVLHTEVDPVVAATVVVAATAIRLQEVVAANRGGKETPRAPFFRSSTLQLFHGTKIGDRRHTRVFTSSHTLSFQIFVLLSPLGFHHSFCIILIYTQWPITTAAGASFK